MKHYIQNVYLHKFQALKALLAVVADENPPDIVAWFGARELLRDMRDLLVRLHSWAVPSSLAIETIAHYSPIVEVGAGTGYWASLLQTFGADVVAYDQYPPVVDEDAPFPVRLWTDVQRASVEEALALHPERTLFLCWPPAGGEMAEVALRTTRAKHAIYVGWQDDDVTGTYEFHDLLKREWELVETVNIPQWPEMRDRLFVYRRR